MSRPRFLADHDLRERISIGLLRRLPDAEFLRCRDIGLETRPDADVLEYAANHGLIVITHDINTMVASAYDRLRGGQAMTGLLVAQQADPVRDIIDSLVLIWLSTEEAEWREKVEFLPL